MTSETIAKIAALTFAEGHGSITPAQEEELNALCINLDRNLSPKASRRFYAFQIEAHRLGKLVALGEA